MKEQGDLRLSIQELSAKTGVSIRTIRYYVSAGLLPSPGVRGKSSTYGEEHVLRLQLVRRLADQHVPLAEIRERLAGLSVEELRSLLVEEEHQQARLADAARGGTSREYVARLLERSRGDLAAASARRRMLFDTLSVARPTDFELAREQSGPQPVGDQMHWRLAPGIELIVKREVYARQRALIEQLIRVTRAMLSDLDR